LCRIVPTRLRQIRTTAAAPADLLCDDVHEVARLDRRSLVRRDAGDQDHLPIVYRRKDDRGRLELVLELIDRLPQGRGIRTIDSRCNGLQPSNVHGRAREIAALAACELRFECGDLLLELALPVERLLYLVLDVVTAGPK